MERSWFGLFCGANVVLTSFGCCSLFQTVSVFVYVGCLACFQVVLLCFLFVSVDLYRRRDALGLDYGVLVYLRFYQIVESRLVCFRLLYNVLSC